MARQAEQWAPQAAGHLLDAVRATRAAGRDRNAGRVLRNAEAAYRDALAALGVPANRADEVFRSTVEQGGTLDAAIAAIRQPARRTAARITPTAACAREALLKARLPEARMDGHGYRAASEGFTARDLPLSQPRVGVYWESPRRGRGRLEDCRKALKAAGFRTEIVADCPPDSHYLVAWTDGRRALPGRVG